MIEQLKTFDSNTLSFEVIDNFSETDEKLAQKLFKEKLAKGFKTVNILIKIDEYKVSKTDTKAFFEDIIFVLRNYKDMGHLAIVAHSKVLKAFVPIDNLFLKELAKAEKNNTLMCLK